MFNIFNVLFNKQKVSPGGSTLLKHSKSNNDSRYSGLSEQEMKDIESHLEKHIGPFSTVFHEIISEGLHVDVIHIPPSEKVPYNVLVTMGVSEFKMNVPEKLKQFEHAEFLIFLPKDWPIDHSRWSDNRYYWPVYMLKTMAKVPKNFDTWFYYGHTIPNQNPPVPFDNSTQMSGALITFPYLVPNQDFLQMKSGEKTVTFWCIAPLYESEWNYKLEHGTDKLEELSEQKGIDLCCINPTRPSVV